MAGIKQAMPTQHLACCSAQSRLLLNVLAIMILLQLIPSINNWVPSLRCLLYILFVVAGVMPQQPLSEHSTLSHWILLPCQVSSCQKAETTSSGEAGLSFPQVGPKVSSLNLLGLFVSPHCWGDRGSPSPSPLSLLFSLTWQLIVYIQWQLWPW